MQAMRGGNPAASLNDYARDSSYVGANMTASDDPNTTNLYVGNISSQVTEEMLFQEFSQFGGKISSVKIMWPRTEEERNRPRNCGFVSFHDRRSAEMAKDRLDGKELQGAELRIGWSKPVKAAGIPVVLAPDAAQKVEEALRLGPSNGLGFSSGPNRGVPAPLPRPDPRVSSDAPAEMHKVAAPAPDERKVIDRTATYVRRYGFDFEALLMDKERGNSAYSFLFKTETPEHMYYRWRVWSLAQGDSLSSWRTDPFQMVEGGKFWVPPEVDFVKEDKEQPKEDKDRDRRRDRDDDRDRYEADRARKHVREVSLNDSEYDELSDILRGMTISRPDVCRGMAFALDHADASKEIVQTIAESLTLASTPVGSKMARLYLVSDILHNSQSGVKNASAYRTGFQTELKNIFKSFGETMTNTQGRMSAGALKDQVMKVLEVWDRWSLYPSHFIQELVAIFLGKEPPPRSIPKSQDDVDGEPMDDVDGEPMDDIDGEALDGEPLDGEDLDGEALDGEPMDGEGPDLRRLPLSELVKLCQQQGLPSHGTQDQLVQSLTRR